MHSTRSLRSIPARCWPAAGAIALLILGSCGSSSGNSNELQLEDPVPQATAGVPFSFQVRIVDSDGMPTTANNTVTAAISANPGGGTLSGTTSVQAVSGVATFTDLSIDKAGVGYTLTLSAGGFDSITSNPFSVVAGAPAQLEFATQPSSATSFADLAQALQVRVLDAHENLVLDPSIEVTLEIGNNPGELILHASGISDPTVSGEERLFELIDPSLPAVLHWLPGNTGLDEVIEVVHNPFTGELHAVIRSVDHFYTGDPATGVVEIVGDGTVDEVKGAAFEAGPAARLLAVVSSNSGEDPDDLFEIDPADGTMSLVGTLVPDMGTLDGFTGLAHDATDDTFFGVTKLGGLGLTGRAFVQVFPSTLTVQFIGDTGDSVASLAIGRDGTVYAVTGDGASVSETLHTVDEMTGAMTELLTLGAGNDGEAIATVPAQLRGPRTVQSVGGIATFEGVQVNAVASGYTLVAKAAGLPDATSAAFDVTAPTPGGTVQFQAADQTVSETDGTLVVPIEIDAAQAHDVVVTMTVAGTADGAGDSSPDHDFDDLFFFQITIPAGETAATGSIGLVDDTDIEGDETIVFFIEDASLAGAIGAVDTHTVTLESDD